MIEKRFFIMLLYLLAAAGCCLGCRSEDTGMLSVQVLDGWDERAVEGAQVIIAETDDVCITDAQGRTEHFRVPILYDRRFSAVLPQDWGAVTVLVYAEGYYPQVVYGVRTEKDACRTDFRVRLFPNDASMGETPFLLVESPDSAWVKALVQRYEP